MAHRFLLAFVLALSVRVPSAFAQGFDAAGIPDGALQKLGELAGAGRSLKSIAFTADGGWAILYGDNGFSWSGIPDLAAQKLSEFSNAGKGPHSIAFAPGGGWAILHNGGGTTGGGTTATGPSAATLAALENQLFTLVNQRRAEAGLAPYTRSPELDAAARRHAQDMATNNNQSHTGSDGTTFSQRILAAGYPGEPTGENMVWGFDTAEGAMNWWMNSEGHRNSILSPTSNQIGIALVHRAGSPFGYYWTQVFGRR
jgi:uncharacterized protein YkwD